MSRNADEPIVLDPKLTGEDPELDGALAKLSDVAPGEDALYVRARRRRAAEAEARVHIPPAAAPKATDHRTFVNDKARGSAAATDATPHAAEVTHVSGFHLQKIPVIAARASSSRLLGFVLIGILAGLAAAAAVWRNADSPESPQVTSDVPQRAPVAMSTATVDRAPTAPAASVAPNAPSAASVAQPVPAAHPATHRTRAPRTSPAVEAPPPALEAPTPAAPKAAPSHEPEIFDMPSRGQ
jgi:hypothetical protein